MYSCFFVFLKLPASLPASQPASQPASHLQVTASIGPVERIIPLVNVPPSIQAKEYLSNRRE
jgi:hypothetical protein